MSREAGISLFDAFGSSEKTLHANTGGHAGIPALNGPTGSGGDIRRGHHRKRSQTNPNAWNNFATQTGLQDVTTNPLDDSIPPWAFARLVIRFDSIKMWIRSIIGVNESLGNRR